MEAAPEDTETVKRKEEKKKKKKKKKSKRKKKQDGLDVIKGMEDDYEVVAMGRADHETASSSAPHEPPRSPRLPLAPENGDGGEDV